MTNPVSHKDNATVLQLAVKTLFDVCVIIPAAQCGLQKSGDPHTEKDGPYELAGGPLIKADTHGLGEEERNGDGSTETGQIVLETKKPQSGSVCQSISDEIRTNEAHGAFLCILQLKF